MNSAVRAKSSWIADVQRLRDARSNVRLGVITRRAPCDTEWQSRDHSVLPQPTGILKYHGSLGGLEMGADGPVSTLLWLTNLAVCFNIAFKLWKIWSGSSAACSARRYSNRNGSRSGRR
jgi:hypothetical protein